MSTDDFLYSDDSAMKLDQTFHPVWFFGIAAAIVLVAGVSSAITAPRDVVAIVAKDSGHSDTSQPTHGDDLHSDLSKHAGEQKVLLAERAEIVAELQQDYATWDSQLATPLWKQGGGQARRAKQSRQ